MAYARNKLFGMVDNDLDNFFNQSGASLNRTRPQTSLSQRNDGYSSFIPNIDLYNFEDPQFEGSKYVLTSPRSLEACQRLSVKPLELLYNPLQDFQDELVPQNVAMRTIYNLYDQHEANRQKSLKLCREERDMLIREDQQVGQGARKRSQGVTRSSWQHSRHKTSPESSTCQVKRSYSISDEGSDSGVDAGSIQRRRTAWTTSIDHDRVTEDEINGRIHARGREEIRQHFSSPQLTSTVRSRGKRKKFRKKQNDTSRCSSLADLGVTGVGRSSSWAKLPASDVKPVSSHLRSKLKLSKNIRIPLKDQKILEAMMQKKESEQFQNRIRRKSELELDKELKDIEKEKTRAEMQRRKNLAIQNKLREHRRTAEEEKRQRATDSLQEDSAKSSAYKQKQWDASASRQEEIRSSRIREKKEKEHRRKLSQEKALQAYQQEQEEFKSLVSQKLEHDLKRANLRKEAKVYEDTALRKSRNQRKQRLHEERKAMLDHFDREDQDDLKMSIELKEGQAKANYLHNVDSREQNIAYNQRDKELRSTRARQSQQLMDEELALWRDDLVRHRKMSEERATEVAQLTAAQKSAKAHEDRSKKQTSQKRNYKKLLKEDEAWKDDMKDTISFKDLKSQLLQQEKEEAIQESRSIAAASQKLREELKKTYQADSFDKKAQQVQMEARIGAGVSSATKNLSTLTIG